MTDGPDRIGRKFDEAADDTVATLASRAIAVLASKRAKGRPLLSERLVLQLISAARETGDTALEGAVSDLLRAGIPGTEILDFYIPEAARRLGDGWVSDGLGFAEVTIATARLQRVVRFLAERPGKGATEDGKSILVIVPEGNFHTLGAMIMTEQLRRIGFSVRLLLGESNRKVLSTVADGHFDAIFFSLGMGLDLAQLRNLIAKTRSAAPTPTPIVAGGTIAHQGTDARTQIGADYVTTDPKEALRLCGLTISHRGGKLPESSE